MLSVTEHDRARKSVTALAGRVRRRMAGRTAPDEAGFGLIEVMVAIVILLVVLVPATYLMDSAVQQSASARERVAATEAAEQALEQLGNDSLTTLEGELDTPFSLGTDTVAGVNYKVTGFLTWQGVGSAPDLCSSGSPPVSISATATVSWGTGSSKTLAEQSVISPAYGLPVFYLSSKLKSGTAYTSISATTAQTIAPNAYLTVGADSSSSQVVQVTSAGDPGTTTIPVVSFTATSTYPANTTAVALPGEGYLAVQVNGESGSAPSDVSQVTVQIQNTATGSSASSYTPDSNGCVFAQELPGTYNVTLGSTSSPPFLNTSESQSPATSVSAGTDLTVSVGSVTVSTWTFDQAGNVTFTPSGSVPVAGGTPVSVLNSGIPGTDWYQPITVGSSATSAYLFPFTSVYTVWYGDCLAEEPSTPPTVSVTPGATASVPMTGLGNLTIEAEATATGPIWAGATVSTTIADPNMSTDGCPADVLSLPATGSTGLSEAGMVETNRQDTAATWAINTATVTDPAITASDQGKQVFGTGIPANSYIGSISGTTFQLYSTPIAASQKTATQLTTTASGSSINVVSETYSVTVTSPPPDNKQTTVTVVVTPGGVVYGSNFYSSQGSSPTPVPVIVP